MGTPLANNIALRARQKESRPLKFDPGEYLIAAGITKGNTLPETITLQIRFGDESGAITEWRDTDVVLTPENGWQDTFFRVAVCRVQDRGVCAGCNGSYVVDYAVGDSMKRERSIKEVESG